MIGASLIVFSSVYYIAILLGIGVKVHRQQPHPPPKVVPFPPTNVRITVVLMNYARPGLLRRSSLLPTLLHHPSITEVLICHANPSTAFRYTHPKVHNINATAWNEQMGLALRFYACATIAQNQWVLHIDDDMELDDSALNQLLAAFVVNPHRLVGHYARAYSYWRAPHRHGYQYATTLFGTGVEVILTKIVLMERVVCQEFVRRMSLMEDVASQSQPIWNGEDIFASLVANVYYRQRNEGDSTENLAIEDLNVWEADNSLKDDDEGLADISANQDRHPLRLRDPLDYLQNQWRGWNHAYYRGRFWSIAKARLATLKKLEEERTDIVMG